MKRFFNVILPLAIIMVLCSCSEKIPPTVFSAEDMQGKTVGVVSGGNVESFVRSADMDFTVMTFGSDDAAAGALKSGAVDCVIVPEENLSSYTGLFSGLKALDEPMDELSMGFMCAAARGDLASALGDVLEELEGQGTIESIIKSYDGGRKYEYNEPDEGYTSELTVGFCENAPYAYFGSDGHLTGIEVDIIRTVCGAAKIRVSFTKIDRADAESSVIKGDTDIVIGGFYKTGETSPLVSFSKGYITQTLRIVTRK